MDVNVAGLHKSSLKTEVRLMIESSGGWYCWMPAFLAPTRKESWACGSRDEGLCTAELWGDGRVDAVQLSCVSAVCTLRLVEVQATHVVLGILSIY